MSRRLGALTLALCVGASLAGATGIGAAAPTVRRTLTAHQVHRIVGMTGFRALRSHRFHIAHTVSTGAITTVVVRLDGARLDVSQRRLRTDLRQAARIAATRPSFATTISLDGKRRKVRYDVAPVGVLAPHRSYLRYLIFTPHDEPLAAITSPRRVPPVQALTAIDVARRINVTLLQDTAGRATWGPGIPAASLFATVESLNTSSYLYVAPKTLDRLTAHHANTRDLVALGREIWANSLGFAILSARAGTSYRTYARQAGRLRFHIYRHSSLRYLTVPATEYARM